MQYIALICAAGIGSRMKVEIPKQYLKLSKGKQQTSILEITATKFLQHPQIAHTFIALHREDHYFNELTPWKFNKDQLGTWFPTNNDKLKICYGLGERIHTVYSLLLNVLEYVLLQGQDPAQTIILIHDAARPGITTSNIDLTISKSKSLTSLDQYVSDPCNQDHIGAILPIVRIVDSLKSVQVTENGLFATGNLNRNEIVIAQTPQVFNLVYLLYFLTKLFDLTNDSLYREYFGQAKYSLLNPNSLLNQVELIKKLEKNQIAETKFRYNKTIDLSPNQILSSLTDDTAVALLSGDKVLTVDLGKHNFKVTNPEDLALAEFYLSQQD